MKILIGQVFHETNTFASVKTTVESFKEKDWSQGQNIIEKHRSTRDYLGGMIDQCEELNIEIIPTVTAFAYPSGIVTSDTYMILKKELIEQIRNVTDYDAICLSLHGAGVVEGIEDMEGDLLQAIRSVVGYKIPLIATLDLHANLTQKMVEEADVLLGNVLYPHVDSYERGKEAIMTAKEMVKGSLKPVSHLVNLPLIIPTSFTGISPAKEINKACLRWENSEKVVDCTFFHGFPYTNISQIGVAVLVTTDNDRMMAKNIAKEISTQIWESKEKFFTEYPSPEEGIQMAIMHDGKPVVINETSDNPGGGSPCDGTYLLRAMIEAKKEGFCFGFIYDPDVVLEAFKAGVGSTIQTKLGGKTDQLHGEPLEISAYVKSLTDGHFTQSSPMGKGNKVYLGKSARLQIEGVDVIVCSARSQVKDEQIFLLHGIDVNQYKVVGLKSSQHFRAAFEPISSKIIGVDSPGLTTIDFSTFNYTNLKEKVYPLHQINEFSYS